MQLRLLGWPDDGPRLDLDHERFAYAGHFGTGRTGLAVALPDDVEADSSAADVAAADEVLAAASFDADRAVEDAARVRYVAVREDRRGEGIGPRLLRFLVDRIRERFSRVRIGVNNPIAYRACYRAGFSFTGEQSGMGELVLEAPGPEERAALEQQAPEAETASEERTARYRAGLELFADRELPPPQRSVLERHRSGTPPSRVE